MLPRTLLIVAAVFLLTATLSSLLTSGQLKEGRGAKVLGEVRPVTAAADDSDEVRGRLPQDGTVEARLGDVVVLRIASAEPDVADIADLGIDVATGPDIDGEVRFVADIEGRFEVRSVVTGRRIGVVRVRSRAGT